MNKLQLHNGPLLLDPLAFTGITQIIQLQEVQWQPVFHTAKFEV